LGEFVVSWFATQKRNTTRRKVLRVGVKDTRIDQPPSGIGLDVEQSG
jgi:hypothetical protein